MRSVGGRASLARLAAPALVAAALVGGGCGGSGPGPDPQPIELTVGGAAQDGSGFVALAGDVTLVPGAQGGFHVWMKYRVTGAPAEMIGLAYTIRRISDGHLVLTATRQQQLGPPGDGGYWELPTAIPAFMCPSPIGVQVRDEPMRFRLDMSTADGAPMASAEAEFTPHCPDGDQSVFCNNICSG